MKNKKSLKYYICYFLCDVGWYIRRYGGSGKMYYKFLGIIRGDKF